MSLCCQERTGKSLGFAIVHFLGADVENAHAAVAAGDGAAIRGVPCRLRMVDPNEHADAGGPVAVAAAGPCARSVIVRNIPREAASAASLVEIFSVARPTACAEMLTEAAAAAADGRPPPQSSTARVTFFCEQHAIQAAEIVDGVHSASELPLEVKVEPATEAQLAAEEDAVVATAARAPFESRIIMPGLKRLGVASAGDSDGHGGAAFESVPIASCYVPGRDPQRRPLLFIDGASANS